MRWYSTPESFDKGEVSALAIAEVIVAITVAVGIAVHFDTLRHVAVSALIAPFLLLRTEESIRLGFRIWEWLDDRWVKVFGKILDDLPMWLLAVLMLPLVVLPIMLIAAVARFFSVAIAAVRNPIGAVRAAPSNWQRQTLCIDSAHPPELLPGAETSDRHDILT